MPVMLMPVMVALALLAQEAAPSGFQIVDLIGTLGVSGVFVWLFFDSTRERRKCQDQLGPLLERIIAALTESTSTLERLHEALRTTRSNEADSLKAEISALIAELRRRGER